MLGVNHLVPADLSKVLCSTLRWTQGPPAVRYGSNKRHVAMKIGICVSGGPDSMALAYLLHNMRHPHDSSVRAFEAHAFIVDHGMRPGSAREASQVRDNLTSLGITSSILNMGSVEKLGSSKELTSFQNSKTETNARAFRYQVILAAARQKNIYKLFLGHHHDDQMETLLMKLVSQRYSTLPTLQGMSLVSPSPYAVQTMGSRAAETKVTGIKSHEPNTEIAGCGESHLESLRPLLGFPKARLIATCKYFQIPFVLDKTNLDPTYTLRNAVRYLRSHVQLPQALQDSSLKSLHNRAVENAKLEKQAGEDFGAMIMINEISKESGMIRFSIRKHCTGISTSYPLGAGVALARFCDLASPINKDLIPSKLSPDVIKSILGLVMHNNVKIRCLRDGTERHYQFLKVDFRTITQDDTMEHTDAPTLQISRQSMRKSEIFANTHTIRFRTSSTSSEQYSDWICWDNRFWIRAKLDNPGAFDSSDLTLRPYQPQDISDVREVLHERERKRTFEQRLKRCAPGHIKYTMPVFVLNGSIVAFPTCDMKLVDLLPFSWNVMFSQPQRAIDFFRP